MKRTIAIKYEDKREALSSCNMYYYGIGVN